MTSATPETPYTSTQIQIWLRGLLTVAWSDGQFDQSEKETIYSMVDSEFAPNLDFETLQPIEPADLAALGLSDAAAQNFLRMAVMVALADGTYSDVENDQIMAFASAIAPESIATLRATLTKLITAQLQPNNSQTAASLTPPPQRAKNKRDPLKPARQWLDQLSVEDPRLARFVCKLIPSDCPFERDVKLFGKKVVHIPPMCKINPLYEQLVGLRFRALSYLADDVGEDVTAYL